MKYPRWKYHSAKPAVVVETEREAEDLGFGWHDTPAEAKAAAQEAFADSSEEDAEIYRKELLARAKALGIAIHHMSGIEKIQAAIDEHQAE